MIRPSDTVLHKPSGETWVVCGVDHEKGELIPCGYPFPSLAKLSDCELVEERYPYEGQPKSYVEALENEGLDRFIYKEVFNERCKSCLNSRQIILENGTHFSCCLPARKMLDCITGYSSYFAMVPPILDNERGNCDEAHND